jgi:hypothetical protein
MVTTRIHDPGHFTTAQIGRVFVIHYPVQTTLERERRIAADFLDYSRTCGGRGVVLAILDCPLLPLTPVEVRAHWRQFLVETASVAAIAAVAHGLVGVAGAATTNLLEHVIDPAFGVPLRVFLNPSAAISWLASFTELGISHAELLEQIAQLRRQG